MLLTNLAVYFGQQHRNIFKKRLYRWGPSIGFYCTWTKHIKSVGLKCCKVIRFQSRLLVVKVGVFRCGRSALRTSKDSRAGELQRWHSSLEALLTCAAFITRPPLRLLLPPSARRSEKQVMGVGCGKLPPLRGGSEGGAAGETERSRSSSDFP